MAWNIYWISLVLLPVSLAQQDSSEELTCKGRCSESFVRGRPCDCDPDCPLYGKCCPDFQQACIGGQTTTYQTKVTTTTTAPTTPPSTTSTAMTKPSIAMKPKAAPPATKSTTKRSPKPPKPKPKPKPKPLKKKKKQKKQKKVSHEIMEERSEQSSSSISTSSKIRRTMATSNAGDKSKKKNGKNNEEVKEKVKAKKSTKSTSKTSKTKAIKVISEEDGSGADNAATTAVTTTITSQPSTTSTVSQPSTTSTTRLPSTTVTTKPPSTITTTILPSTTATTRPSSTATTARSPTATASTAAPTTMTTKTPTTMSTTTTPTTMTSQPFTTTTQPNTEHTTEGNKDTEPTNETPASKNTNTTITQVTTTTLITSKSPNNPTSTVDKTTQYTSTFPTTLLTTKRHRVTYYPTTKYTTTYTARHPVRITNITREYIRPEKIVSSVSYQDYPEEMNLCNGKPANGIVPLQNGSLAVFRGHYYWLLNGTSSPSPCPRKITQVWGIPSPIDSVFSRCNCDGKNFFIKDAQYWRFTNDKMDPGYPKPLLKGFGGLNGKIVAALSVAKHQSRPESVYFFKKGGNVQQYTYKQESAKKCQKKIVTVNYPAYKAKTVIRRQRRRFERAVRPHQIFRTIRIKQYPVVQISQQPTGVLQPEVKITSYWRGFPKEVNSVISVPNEQKSDGYDYYAFSKDQYYNVDVGSRIARPVTRLTGQSVSKAWYKCPPV
ncbi:proteoglycan 4 [Sphaerodactylus townsendi]|uniref:proteoglycan 4 n=1 Tax=Sphaerodactylus townsendi TaxID=933632 RepID=UPI0020274A23|nr:proteoglycan 4 [Sphaerodactylus townsendi]